jgi:hypothetical protein
MTITQLLYYLAGVATCYVVIGRLARVARWFRRSP